MRLARSHNNYWELLVTSTAGDVSPIRPNIWLCKFGVSQAVYMSVIVTAFTIGLWCSLWEGGERSGATNFTIHQEVNSSLYACSGKGTCSVMETLIHSTHVISTLTWTSGEMTKNTRLFQLYSVKVKALWRYLKCCEFLLLIVYTHFPSVLILGFLTEVLNCI